MVQKINLTKDDFVTAMEFCNTRQELADYFHVSLSTCKRRLKEYGLSTFKRVFDTSKFMELYNSGLNDCEIAEKLNCKSSTISYYRNSLKLKPNFHYNRDILIDKCKSLASDKSIKEIANELNLDERIISYFINEPDLPKTEKELTDDEFQIIIGDLLGDGNLSLNKSGNLGQLRFAHSSAQKEYCIWKALQLQRIMYFETPFKEHKHYEQRAEKELYSFYALSKETSFFKDMFYRWYIQNPESTNRTKNIKRICKEDLYKLSGLGLAVWFMDDGYHEDSGYLLCTQCFSDDDLKIIVNYFKDIWNIDVKIRSSKEIYIPAKFRLKFKKIVEPYIHDDCKYKLLKD